MATAEKMNVLARGDRGAPWFLAEELVEINSVDVTKRELPKRSLKVHAIRWPKAHKCKWMTGWASLARSGGRLWLALTERLKTALFHSEDAQMSKLVKSALDVAKMTTAWPLLLTDAASGPEQVGPRFPQGTGPLIVCVAPHGAAMLGRAAARIVPSPSPHSTAAAPFVLPPKLATATTPDGSPLSLDRYVAGFQVLVVTVPSKGTTVVPVAPRSSAATVICPLLVIFAPESSADELAV
jgi:hypothetical protein